jgi:hypothetical protein
LFLIAFNFVQDVQFSGCISRVLYDRHDTRWWCEHLHSHATLAPQQRWLFGCLSVLRCHGAHFEPNVVALGRAAQLHVLADPPAFTTNLADVAELPPLRHEFADLGFTGCALPSPHPAKYVHLSDDLLLCAA